MSREIVYTKNAPEPIGPYSQAVKLSTKSPYLIYSSGQIPIIPQTGNIAEGGIKEQTRQSIENIKSVLIEAGSDLSKVVKTTVFLKNMSDFAAMNEVYAGYFDSSKPARSTVEVAKLPREALVEIEVIAYV